MRQTDVLKLLDGVHRADKGLFLEIKRSGATRSWVLDVQMAGKRYRRGLGSAKTMTLAQAKIEAERVKAELRAGHPAKKHVEAPKAEPTFADIYMDAINAKAEVAQWRNEKSRTQWINTVETYAVPVLAP